MHACSCALIRISCHLVLILTLVLAAYYSGDNGNLRVKDKSLLESFYPATESIKDYKEQLTFYGTTHQVPESRSHKTLLLPLDLIHKFLHLHSLKVNSPVDRGLKFHESINAHEIREI